MRASPEQSDENLLRLSLEGDESAFTTLYRRRQAALYRFALQMCGSESVAEDVTQEVFMALLREAHRFDPSRGALSSFLYGVARNQVLRRLEKERAFVALGEEHEEASGHDAGRLTTGEDPLARLARGERVETVRQAVLALPVHYREVVVLCELQEMSYVEAANVLGCAVGTVRSRLHRARSLLCERLRVFDEGEESAKGFDAARCFA
jgi:RNA polymerase sigma-70 factor (ECF subfamily)